MKKTLIAIAALGAFCQTVQAQSTVTIYGVLDANIQSLKTNVAGTGALAGTVQSPTQAKVDSAGLSGNRWGIRLTEDLGGGWSAVGKLESGFAIDSGASLQGGALFGRQANVGLSSTSFGTVIIGRNTSPYGDVSADHAMMETSVFDPSNINNGNSATAAATLVTAATPAARVAAALPFLTNRNTTWLGHNSRFSNSVKYNSPVMGGFSVAFMYGMGEDKTTTTSASRAVSLAAKYVNGPFLVSAGYQSDGVTRTATTSPRFDNKIISASYDFGIAKFGVGYNLAQYKELAPGISLAAQKEFNLSVIVPVGAAITVSAGYGRSKGNDFGTSSGFGAQVLYAMSKRTTLYVGAQSTKPYDGLVNSIRAVAPASNFGNTTAFGGGIRHLF